MAHIIRTQHSADTLTRQLNHLHGKTHLPADVKQRLEAFMALATKPDKERVVDPYIPGLNLNFDTVSDPEEIILKDILAELLEEGGAGDGGEYYGEEEEGEGEEEDNASPFIDIENYILPAYLAKDRLI
jgi:hypothetical protein